MHEPLSVLTLELNRSMHSWGLDTSLDYMRRAMAWPCCSTVAKARSCWPSLKTARAAQARTRPHMRTYGGRADPARMRRARMQLWAPRRMPSMTGYGLEITGYIPKE